MVSHPQEIEPRTRTGRRRYMRSTKKLQLFLQALGWSALALGAMLAAVSVLHGNAQLLRWAAIYVAAAFVMLALRVVLAKVHKARKRKYRGKRDLAVGRATGK